MLHPSLMDGAFQCALGMALNEAGASAEGAALPFALDRVEIFGTCVPEMAVHIRTSDKGEQTSRVRTLDLDLMDMDGWFASACRASRRGSWRSPLKSRQSVQQTKCSCSRRTGVQSRPERTANPAQFTRRYVLLCDRSEAFGHTACGWTAQLVLPRFPKRGVRYRRRFLRARGRAPRSHTRGRTGLRSGAAASRDPERSRPACRTRRHSSARPSRKCRALAASCSRSARRSKSADVAQRLEAYAQRPDLDCIREEGGTALEAGWRELQASKADRHVPWRDGAVYLITGGSGGLGRLFAREIASRAAGVTIILASRTPSMQHLAELLPRSDERLAR